MAKVSELIEQARALEAQGESAKALAIYQHVLPHVEGMPAIKADLSLKAGDIMLKLGNTAGALAMYEAAGTQCAMHGSSKGALTVASKIQQAAPNRHDVLLSFAGQMVKHGHAGPAVDVLIQHAKQANIPQMLQELEPLSGRPSEDVRPLVEMLLDQPAPPPPATPTSPTAAPRRPGDLSLEPMSLEEELSSIPTLTPTAGTPGAPSFEPPPPPPPPMPPPSSEGIQLDVGPPSQRETAAINLRTSQVMREAVEREEVVEREAAEQDVARRVSSGHRRPFMPPPPRPKAAGSGKLKWMAIPVLLVAVAAGLVYFGVLPAGFGKQLKNVLPKPGEKSASTDSARPAPVAAQTPAPATPRPDSFKLVAGPPTVRGAPAQTPVAADTGRQPPVKIDGLMVADFDEGPAGFRVVQRQVSGRYLLLTGRPLADSVGEPAVGEVRIDSLPGDSAVAVTSFEGYVVTVRGVIAPAALQSLLLQLVSRGH